MKSERDGVNAMKRGKVRERRLQHKMSPFYDFNTAECGLCFVRKLSPNRVREDMRELSPNCLGPATTQHSFAVHLVQDEFMKSDPS